MQYKCAFCSGKGEVRRTNVSPFDLICQVCSGKGVNEVKEPFVTCRICKGTGRQYALITCGACMGKGVLTLKEPSVPCPDCSGGGSRISERLYCLTCGGKGRVEK